MRRSSGTTLDRPPEIPVAPILRDLTGEDIYEPLNDGRWKKISCPFHQDRTPSASISYLGFQCFSCGREGDAYKLIMTETGCDFPSAVSRAKEIAGVEGRGVRRQRRRSSSLLGYSGNQ